MALHSHHAQHRWLWGVVLLHVVPCLGHQRRLGSATDDGSQPDAVRIRRVLGILKGVRAAMHMAVQEGGQILKHLQFKGRNLKTWAKKMSIASDIASVCRGSHWVGIVLSSAW